MGPRNRFQGMNSASLCSLAGRYDNPIPPRFLAPIDFLKIPALLYTSKNHHTMLKKTLYRACDFLLRRSWFSHFVTCSFLNFGLEKSRIVLQLWVRRSPGRVRRSSGVSAPPTGRQARFWFPPDTPPFRDHHAINITQLRNFSWEEMKNEKYCIVIL
jgi:hypothetical protein